MTIEKAPDVLYIGMVELPEDEEVGLLAVIQPEDTRDASFEATLIATYQNRGNDGLEIDDIVMVGKGQSWRLIRCFEERRTGALKLGPLPEPLHNRPIQPDETWGQPQVTTEDQITPHMLMTASQKVQERMGGEPATLERLARLLGYDDKDIAANLLPNPTRTPDDNLGDLDAAE